jgi:hypothetical protein
MTEMDRAEIRQRHDSEAPYWAAFMAFLCLVGVSTAFTNLGRFWNGYVLDMTGPAWSYILFRGRFRGWADNQWTRFFTPGRTLVLFIAVVFVIEFMQYLGLYDATFDPWDLLAYLSILLPVYLVDRRTWKGPSSGHEDI